MNVTLIFQCLANGTNAAIHHVAGRHDVNASCSVSECLLFQNLDGDVVQDVARFIEQTILAVACVGVKRNVGHDAQRREILFECGHHVGNEPLWVGCLFAIGCFQVAADHREKCYHRNAQLDALLCHIQQEIEAHAFNAGHGSYWLAPVLAL